MMGVTRLLLAAALAAALFGVFGLVAWDPEGPLDLVFRSLALGGLWTLSELKLAAREHDPQFDASRIRAIRRFNRAMFAPLIALVIVAPLLIRLAADSGLITDTSVWNARRAVMLAVGVLIASTGNRMPKLISPFGADAEPSKWQSDHRILGWTTCLSGIALAVAAFLPRPVMEWVVIGSILAVLASATLVLVRRSRQATKSTR